MEEDTTLFFEAVRSFNLEEAEICLERGVDVNSKDEGYTALHLALFLHRPGFDAKPFVNFLLEKG